MPRMKPVAVGHQRELVGTVSITHLARRWRTSRRAIRQLMGHGALDFVQVNGQLWVPIRAIERHERELSGHGSRKRLA